MTLFILHLANALYRAWQTPDRPVRFICLLELWLTRQFTHEDKRIAVHSGGSPIVEAVSELTVSADHQRRLKVNARGAVVTASAFVAAHRRFWHADRAFRRVIDDTDTGWNARADDGARDGYAMIVIRFDPIIIHNADFFRVLFADPERFQAARESQHTIIIKIIGVDMPFGVRRQIVQLNRLAFALAFIQIAKRNVIWARLIRGQMFAMRQVTFVIEIEVLPAGQRAPRDEAFHVQTES